MTDFDGRGIFVGTEVESVPRVGETGGETGETSVVGGDYELFLSLLLG